MATLQATNTNQTGILSSKYNTPSKNKIKYNVLTVIV
jgi:hypothetical protein